MFKIGQGIDVHAFAADRKLIIGGVEIPHEKGLAGHSDADVLIHAICDAILGAAGLGDIGLHFPDTDEKYHNIDSKILLREVVSKIHKENFEIVNVDSTVIAQSPKLSPYTNSMRDVLSAILKIGKNNLNIKATTTENLGFTGRKEGIAAHAICLLQSTI
ncbi:MAG: 2-C-methyl-D-erythritol 2,4-cyclodiphosphate synthase [Chlamydiae bacterium]|nr:MAG: 2-C-methyl-D-erythritol 2,4-cyclodiphosphate synthase [Chlamydiota bacterium]